MKMLPLLVIVQLFWGPALMAPSVDYWDVWGPYGECSRSCGGGVAMRSRRCITQRTDGGHNCVGQDKTYRSCNLQECPEGSRDFREEQCAQFDGTEFQGKLYNWLPYYGAENPCELNCMPRGENFYYRLRSEVVDGTPCHPGRRDVCVAGVCKRLGCDNTLKSSQQEDPCLECGGNGQSCHRVKSSFAVRGLSTGYNQIVVIPAGATTISIRETVATRNYLAIRNLRGEYYLNGHWVIDFSKATPVPGTTLYYQRGPEGANIPETIIGRGPTTEPLVIELISQEPNQGVEYEFYLPNSRSTGGYYWSLGSWSACTKDCGSGYQSRSALCSSDNEAYPDYLCASLPRPQTNRTCNRQPCPQTHSFQVDQVRDSAQTSFQPFASDRAAVLRPETNPSTVLDTYGAAPAQPACVQASYGCCQDGVTTAQGPNKEGCVEYVASGPPAAQPGLSARVRQATSAAREARGRQYLQARRPSSVAGSLILKGVSIDKSDPPTVEALVGQTVVLPCRVSPPPSSTVVVEWRRDGVPLPTRRHHQQPNGSLLVGPVTKSDSGWFLCVATRERERDHRYVYLSVSEGSSQLISSSLPKDGPSLRFSIDRSSSSLLEMRAGQTATLPCIVVPPSALQSVRIQWSKDGRPLGESRFTQNSDGSLIIAPLKSGDAGVYTCTASSQQQLEQRQLQLRVQADLKITTAPDNVEVSEGGTALLPCVVSGDNINIGWSRNGVPIRPDGRAILQSSDGSLILNNVKPSDEGTYTCNAYTGIYSVSATADVRVVKGAQQEPDVPPDCVDQPDLANCELIVYARLCSNPYYASFCCASCTRHSQRSARFAQLG